MKHVLCGLLMLITLFTCSCAFGEEILQGYEKGKGYDYVLFGQYPQTVEGGKTGDASTAWRWKGSVIKDPSAVTVTPEPILWRVLAAGEGKVYLLSEYILFAMPMHEDYTAYKKFRGDFAQTDLCAFLNGPFAEDAFTEEEAALLIPDEAYGKVFLLSSEELKNKNYGFTGNQARKAWATEYAVRITGAFVYQMKMGCSSPYWTRTPSTSAQAAGRAARCTKQDGSVGYYNTSNPEEGARPAVVMDATALSVASGSGTLEDPWVIVPAP